MTRYVRWITENFWWKVLAVVIAVVLWILVANEPELSVFVTVPLTYKNLPEELELGAEPVNSIFLELRGPSGELRGVGDSGGPRPAVTIDMSGVRAGERTFPIGNGNVKLARGVHLVRAIPSEARFEFERRATREIKVVPRFSGEGANGYGLAQFTVDPPTLEVVGPSSRVERLVSVVTDRINLANVVGTSEFRVNAFVEDPFLRFVDSPRVTVVVTMKKQ